MNANATNSGCPGCTGCAGQSCAASTLAPPAPPIEHAWLDRIFLHPRWGLVGSLAVFALVLFFVFEVSAFLDGLTVGAPGRRGPRRGSRPTSRGVSAAPCSTASSAWPASSCPT